MPVPNTAATCSLDFEPQRFIVIIIEHFQDLDTKYIISLMYVVETIRKYQGIAFNHHHMM